MNKHKVLGLGTNVGDRLEQISNALALLNLRGLHVVKQSSLYETEPVDCNDENWFLNQVVVIETDALVHECHKICKRIEKEMGRVNTYRNAPRPIDIDLLLWDDVVVESAELTVPHPRMHSRKFVLVPLLEVLPDPLILVWLAKNIHGQTIRKLNI